MKVFVTGATGFVGSAVVKELIAAGHQVLGLTRSEAGAQALIAAGAEVHRGDLEDLGSLRRGAANADGIIHTGFIHDFARFKEVCEVDRKVIGAFGDELTGSDRPLIIASGVAILTVPGRLVTEQDRADASNPIPRIATEFATDAIAEKGVRASLVRLPPTVHGEGDHGFIHMLINLAREKGVSAYIGEGQNHWPAVHRFDAAKMFRLALEKNAEPGTRYHSIAEEGVPFKDIAQAIGRGLNIPVVSKTQEEAGEHFGWFAHFAGIDCPASSKLSRETLGWSPEHFSLIEDLDAGYYFKA